MSLSKADVPFDWKCSKIVPTPKANDSLLLSSYRPVSLLCRCSNVLEHIINHISSFIENNYIIDNRQHGSRKGFLTATMLLELIHEFSAASDIQSQIDIIFLDFEKAFNRISHPKLLSKLQPLLKNNLLLSWIEAYLFG